MKYKSSNPTQLNVVQVKRVKTPKPLKSNKNKTKNNIHTFIYFILKENTKSALYLTHETGQFNIALSIIVFYLFVLDYTCPRNNSYGQGYVCKKLFTMNRVKVLNYSLKEFDALFFEF
jgi:hypothetical protein